MGAYLAVRAELRFYINEHDFVERLHELYKKHGFEFEYIETNDDISYEDACKINQKCFDERIDFRERKHYRMLWRGSYVSCIETYPSIWFDYHPDYPNKKLSSRRQECILFPEEEVTTEVFQNILKLVTDLYAMEDIHAIEIQKEE